MAEQVLRDKSGKLLGRIKEAGGNLELRDAKGILVGRYYPKHNTTRDKAGKLIGRGNLLTMLLSNY